MKNLDIRLGVLAIVAVVGIIVTIAGQIIILKELSDLKSVKSLLAGLGLFVIGIRLVLGVLVSLDRLEEENQNQE